jgi:rubrerythrin
MEKFGSVEEILDFAIGREIEAHQLFVKLAAMVESPELCSIFEKLAEEELEHRAKLQAIKAGKITLEPSEIDSLGLADSVEEIKPHAKMDYRELLALGIKKEDKSYKLYTKLASKAQSPELKNVFLRLAEEEAGHKMRFEIEYDLETF